MNRLVRVLAAIAALVVLASCTALRDVPRADVTAASPGSAQRYTRFSAARGQRVFGYTTIDGRYHALAGTARLVGDSLEFARPGRLAHGLMDAEPATVERVALAELVSVRSEAFAPLPTVLTVTVLIALIGTWMVVGFVASGLGS